MAIVAPDEMSQRSPDEMASRCEAESASPTDDTNAAPCTFDIGQGDRGCLVRLRGDIDAAAVSALSAQIEPWSRHCRSLTLDLSQVNFIDSAGLRAILDLYRSLHAREACLRLLEGEQGNVGRVLRHAGLESLIVNAEEAAVTECDGAS